MNMLLTMQSKTLDNHPFAKIIQTRRGPIPTCVCDAADRLRRVRESNDPAWLHRVIDWPQGIQVAVRNAARTRLQKIQKITHPIDKGSILMAPQKITL